MKVLSVKIEEEPEAIEINNDLESMQKLVGGYIEFSYPYKDNVCIVCNEEGKINGMMPNRIITNKSGDILDIIHGDFFICGISEYETTDMPENLIEKYKNKMNLFESSALNLLWR